MWDRCASPVQAARADVRHVVRIARRDDRDARTDASRVLRQRKRRKKCRVPRVQNSDVLWSLKMIFGVLETLHSVDSRGINAFSSNDGMGNDRLGVHLYRRARTEGRQMSKETQDTLGAPRRLHQST